MFDWFFTLAFFDAIVGAPIRLIFLPVVRKAGMSWKWLLGMLVPVVGLLILWKFSLAYWPSRSEVSSLRWDQLTQSVQRRFRQWVDWSAETHRSGEVGADARSSDIKYLLKTVFHLPRLPQLFLSERKIVPASLGLVSAGLYVLSLFGTAFTVPRETVNGWACLGFGWVGFFSSDYTWLANPILTIAWVALLVGSMRVTAAFSLLSLAVMLSFLTKTHAPMGSGCSGADCGISVSLMPIISYGLGYWCWLASAAALLLASLYGIYRPPVPASISSIANPSPNSNHEHHLL